ncbi:methyltransferase, partial [Mycobacterium sp. ITM-2017-0098]
AEGISMYLTEDEGTALLRRVVDRFPSGELQIDFYNWVAIRSQKTQTLVRKTGSTLYWAVNSPEDILSTVPGTRLLASATLFDASTASRTSAPFKALGRAIRILPPVRNAIQYHRYAFGPVS